MSYTTAVLALSPVRYYKLGESSGIVATDSSTSNVAGGYGAASGGTWTGGTHGVTGANSETTAATFNGSSGYIDSVGAVPASGATTFTWSGWIKPAAGGLYRTIYSRYQGGANRFEISLGNSGDYGADLGLVVAVGSIIGGTGTILALDVWQHLVVVFDGAQATASDRVKVYVDKVEKTISVLSTPWPSAIPTISADGTIAARTGGNGGTYWSGGQDDIAMFAAALTSANVTTLYDASDSAAVPANLTAAVVHSSGAKITLTFSASTTIFQTSCTVTVNGYPAAVTSVSGAATTWDLLLGLRWVLAGATVAVTHSSGTVTATNSSAVVRSQAKHVGREFGMFVHWGLETYAAIEWSDGTESINTFSPTASVSAGIDQWIAGAIAAGMSYIVLVAKHHGGFCLWPSADSTRTVAQTTWYGANGSPDIVSLFVTKCRAAGLGVGLYFSIWDRWWESTHPGFSGAAYTAHCQAQLTEVLTNYGPIDLIWMDGLGWGTSDGVSYSTISAASILNHIASLQPNCIRVINDHQGSLASSDLLIYEVHITGGPASGNLIVSESCETIRTDNKWFGGSGADSGLSSTTISTNLASMISRRSAYLLNCPPGVDAKLPAVHIATLAAVGASTPDPWRDPIVEATSGTAVGFPSSSRLGGVLQT